MKILDSIFKKKKRETQPIKEAVIHEAMYSDVYCLVENHEEIVLRIHPSKREAYNSIIKGKAKVSQSGEEIRITDVLLVLNSPSGNVQIKYSSLADIDVDSIKNTTHIQGFDASGEPLIHEMIDGSVRVVFSSLPPQNFNSFNLDEFSNCFIAEIRCGISHDDREIFHIPRPHQNTVDEVKSFLERYRG